MLKIIILIVNACSQWSLRLIDFKIGQKQKFRSKIQGPVTIRIIIFNINCVSCCNQISQDTRKLVHHKSVLCSNSGIVVLKMIPGIYSPIPPSSYWYPSGVYDRMVVEIHKFIYVEARMGCTASRIIKRNDRTRVITPIHMTGS